MTKITKGVSLNPKTFSDDAGLLDLPMEDVVSLLKNQEKNRSRGDRSDEDQLDAVVGVKHTPKGLIVSLRTAAMRCNVSRSLLTQCLSHHVVAWYDSLPELKELSDTFYEVYEAADDLGFPELCDRMREASYGYASMSDKTTTFRTVGWVKNKLDLLALPLGIPAGVIFSVGLSWSVCTTDSGRSRGTIDKYLKKEIDNFRDYIADRLIRVHGFRESLNLRCGHKTS